MKTVLNTGGLLSRPARHADLALANREVQDLQTQLDGAKKRVSELRVQWEETDALVKEAQIAQAMGAKHGAVAHLKAQLDAITENGEVAEARVVGIKRLLFDAAANRDRDREALLAAQREWCEDESKRILTRAHEAASALQASQRDGIALARFVGQLGLKWPDGRQVIPTYLIWAQVISEHGAGNETWPWMGDRRVHDSQVAPRMSEIQAAMDSL